MIPLDPNRVPYNFKSFYHSFESKKCLQEKVYLSFITFPRKNLNFCPSRKDFFAVSSIDSERIQN
jgi:hypothetical protein